MESKQLPDQNQILDTIFCVYNYMTEDYEPGTVIINKDLSIIMDEQKLLKMDNMNVKLITLRDLLETGFVSVGSIDLMDTMKITYPCPKYSESESHLKARIEGKYMHGSRKQLIVKPTGIDFELDPSESDDENEKSGNGVLKDEISKDEILNNETCDYEMLINFSRNH